MHADRFVRECLRTGPELIEAKYNIEEAVSGSDLICTTTASPTPIMDGHWISDGCHINAVGFGGPKCRELDTLTVKKAKVFTDRLESLLSESGRSIH